MTSGLEGTVVMVSGAAGGIGAEVVRHLVNDGGLVLAGDRPGSQSARAADPTLLGEQGQNLHFFEGDLANPSESRAFAERALEQFGRVDALVNVAGYWRTRPFLEVTPADLDEMIDANLKTAFYASQAVAPHMLAQGSGSIVHFASTAGEYGSISPGSHYAAAKGGVIALTKSMARELSPAGVRVNAISPGPIDTGALSGGTVIDRDLVAKRTLFGRLGTPDDIADAVAFLVSPASSFITGQVLGVNGGSRL
jgi:NAD(P)-dependent dehydrogenase (short-subunit alcohol dehydrogenase family)